MKQARIFLSGEGDAWVERNKAKLNTENDPIIYALKTGNPNPFPFSVLEVGCANGWRMDLLEKIWGCQTFGIDPSSNNDSRIDKGIASDLSAYTNGMFDAVIYGFCLYLCDRADLPKIVYEGDRVLKDGGYLVVFDFHEIPPFKTKYKHRSGVFSYKMDHSRLWSVNPSYNVIHRSMHDDRTSVTILKKDIEGGWPLHEQA